MIRTGFLRAAQDVSKNTRRRELRSSLCGESAILLIVTVCLSGRSISVVQAALPAPFER